MFRVLDSQWHIGHQYEMLKFPFVRWTWLMQYKRRYVDKSLRGDLEQMMEHATYYRPGDYDVAILHLDQECLTDREWNRGKGTAYRDMNEVIGDIPKIVIMHGSPHFPEAAPPFNDPDHLRRALQEVVGKNTLIVNSNQAAKEWGLGRVVLHGMDQNEWYDLPKLPRVVTTLSPGGMPSYYDREFLAEVKAALLARDIVHCHIGVDYVPRDWDDYRQVLGQSLVYFNPTFASPMPRSRTEAMLSGCCVVTTPHHDAGSFISHGRNGFLVERQPEVVAELIEGLVKQPEETKAIGAEGRRTAEQLFSWQRFADEWKGILSSVSERAA